MRSFASLVVAMLLGLLFPLPVMGWLSSTVGLTGRQTVVRHMSDDDSALRTGKVKWFDTTKGFGFIIPDDGGPDVFVHQTAINVQGFRSLAEEEAVEFTVVMDERTGRAKAMDVTGPNGAPVQGAPFRPSDDYGSY